MLLQRLRSDSLLSIMLAVSGGILIAVLVTGMLTVLPLRWTAMVVLGLAFVLPTVIIKEPKIYLFIFFLSVLIVAGGKGKNITKYFIDTQEVINLYSFPSSGFVGISIYPADMIFIMLFVPWLLQILTKQKRIYFPKVGYVLLAALGWMTLSAFFKAPHFYLSFVALFHFYKFFLVYIYFINAFNSKKFLQIAISSLLICLFLSGGITLLGYGLGSQIALLSVLSGQQTSDAKEDLVAAFADGSNVKRAGGTLNNPASQAQYFLFLIPLCVTLFFVKPTGSRRWLYLLLGLLGGAGLFVTYSRSALLGLAGGGTVCLWLLYRRGYISPSLSLAIVCSGLVLSCFAAPFLYEYMTSRPKTVGNRMPGIEKGIKMIIQDPILGVGWNNSTAVKNARFREDVKTEKDFPIHCYYLIVASEIGLVGFILYFGFFVLIALCALRCSRSRDPAVATISIAIFSAYVAIGIHILADHFVGHILNTMLYLYAALVIKCQHLERDQAQVEALEADGASVLSDEDSGAYSHL